MTNPFYTLGYGGPNYFCDREKETAQLLDALRNGRNVALISPRRLGKTGLIQHVFHHLQQEDPNHSCFYLDIFSTQSQTDLVRQMSECILCRMDSFSEKFISSLTTFFKSCRPVFSVDVMIGAPTVSLDVQAATSEHTLREIIEYMKASGHECFVAIDEFQQILEYPERGTEALLRSMAQFAPNVHFIFSGSKQHLMTDIFSSPKRPFYQSTARMGLQPLDRDVYYDFAARQMREGGKLLPRNVFDTAYDFAHGFTYYIQDIMNRLFSIDSPTVETSHLYKVFGTIREEGEVVYKDYCDLLAKGQLRLLRAIAADDICTKPFEAEFIRRHHLTAVSSIKLALNALVKNGVVAKSDNGYFIYDRYLSLWLNR